MYIFIYIYVYYIYNIYYILRHILSTFFSNYSTSDIPFIDNIIYIPYGSKHLLRRYLTPQIIPQTLPKKVFGSIGIYIYIYTPTLTIVISAINHSEMGVMFTNLANELGHHLTYVSSWNHHVFPWNHPGLPPWDFSDPFWDEAIKRRADSLAAASNATEDQAPLLRAPLRVFIYDATERGGPVDEAWENHRKTLGK